MTEKNTNYISIDLQCSDCDIQISDFFPKCDVEEGIGCPECENTMQRVYLSMPGISCPPGAYGGGKFHNKAWGKYKETVRLKAERAQLPRDDKKRADINKAIAKASE